MKKVLMVVVAGLFISASASSCKKCGTCKVNGTSSGVEYCAKDNQTVYDAAKLSCEANGGTWDTK